MVCSSAPGKVILFGEHFVVKNKPAIAVAVDLYARTTIEESSEHVLESKQMARAVNLEGEVPREFLQFKEAYRAVARRVKTNTGFRAVIDSDIPIASGMGSSAATAVSFVHALLTFYGLDPRLKLVNEIAYEAERVVHVRPSGIDNTVSTYGGLLYYRRDRAKRVEVEWPENLYILVVDTGIKRNTGDVVKHVLNLYDKHADVYEELYRAYEKLVSRAYSYILSGKFEELGELMNVNHGLLVSIDVSNRVIDDIVQAMREMGALGSKLSGAGRGGIVIGLFNNKEACSEAREIFSERGFRTFIVRPASAGVRSC